VTITRREGAVVTEAETGREPVAQTLPTLSGPRVTLRPGRPPDAVALHAIMAEPGVARWWGEPDPVRVILDELRGTDTSALLVIVIDGQVVGGIQYHEEDEPMYRHAGIDIYLGDRFQGQGTGPEAVGLLARFLLEKRGHHRLTIDPAAANSRAIRCYAKVGFRPVGILRQYERGPDGTFHDGLLMEMLATDLSGAW
jgi:aminoglycoside 6'-N-acetyltransferase